VVEVDENPGAFAGMLRFPFQRISTTANPRIETRMMLMDLAKGVSPAFVRWFAVIHRNQEQTVGQRGIGTSRAI
jgi:hypothetical protein